MCSTLIGKCCSLSRDSYNSVNGLLLENYDTDCQCYVKSIAAKGFIIFRGTSSMKDFFIDMNIIKSSPDWCNDKGVKVHKGFLEQYNSIRDRLLSVVRNFKEVVVTGHSLGGALATIAAFDFVSNSVCKDVRCVSFGSPRVGNTKFSLLFKSLGIQCARVVNHRDPIPHVPSPFRFTHVKGCVYINSRGEWKKKSPWNMRCNPLEHRISSYAEVLGAT